MWDSTFQILSIQSFNCTSSSMPLMRDIPAWVCILTKAGIAVFPRQSTTSTPEAGTGPDESQAEGTIPAILLPSIRMSDRIPPQNIFFNIMLIFRQLANVLQCK